MNCGPILIIPIGNFPGISEYYGTILIWFYFVSNIFDLLRKKIVQVIKSEGWEFAKKKLDHYNNLFEQ